MAVIRRGRALGWSLAGLALMLGPTATWIGGLPLLDRATSIATIAACSASAAVWLWAADWELHLPFVAGMAHLGIALMETYGQVIRAAYHHPSIARAGTIWLLAMLATIECAVVAFTLFLFPAAGSGDRWRKALRVAVPVILAAAGTGALIAYGLSGGVLTAQLGEPALYGARTAVMITCAAALIYLRVTWRRESPWISLTAAGTLVAIAFTNLARSPGSFAGQGASVSAIGHYFYSVFYGIASFLTVRRVLTQRRDQLRHALSVTERDRRRLLNRLLAVQEETSAHVSSELHGQVGQSLVMLLGRLDPDRHRAADAEERLQEARRYALEALEGVRHVARLVRPAGLGDVNLSTAVEAFVAEFCQAQGLRGSVEVIGSDDGTLSSAVKNALHFGIREALANVARHSGATDFSVVLNFRGDTVTATIDDNGRGFDVAVTPPGLGQIGSLDRLDAVGGTVSIESGPSGTTVTLRVPRKE